MQGGSCHLSSRLVSLCLVSNMYGVFSNRVISPSSGGQHSMALGLPRNTLLMTPVHQLHPSEPEDFSEMDNIHFQMSSLLILGVHTYVL